MFTGLFGIAAYKFAYGGLLPAFGGSTTVDMVFVFPNFWVRALMGSVLFGFGMTIAGGCAVGSLWRAGEGQVKLMLAVLTMTFVMPFVSRDIMGEGKALPTWLKSFDGGMDKLFLPNEIGYGWSLVLVSGVLMLWYWFAKWNDRTGKFAAM